MKAEVTTALVVILGSLAGFFGFMEFVRRGGEQIQRDQDAEWQAKIDADRKLTRDQRDFKSFAAYFCDPWWIQQLCKEKGKCWTVHITSKRNSFMGPLCQVTNENLVHFLVLSQRVGFSFINGDDLPFVRLWKYEKEAA